MNVMTPKGVWSNTPPYDIPRIQRCWIPNGGTIPTLHWEAIRKCLKFWPVVEAVASMSKDPSTKVGAVALDDRFNIVSTAYNGFPRGVHDHAERYSDREVKLQLVSHAEQNLVAQAAYAGRSLRGTTILVSQLFPCSSCAKSIIQAGVSRIITPPPGEVERWAADSAWSVQMFAEADLEVVHVEID